MENWQVSHVLANLMPATFMIIFLSCIGVSDCIPSSYNEVELHNPYTDYSDSCDRNAAVSWTPCSEKYLLESYFNTNYSLVVSDFQTFLDKRLCSNFCERLISSHNPVFKLSSTQRQLIGEGSHRLLRSSIKLTIPSDATNTAKLDTLSCKVVLIEKFPRGVFADPFELQHLVHRDVFADAVVFGETNLELPSALTNQSIVEVHMNIDQELQTRDNRSVEITMELPLHTRYPPLDGSGYSRVELGALHTFMHCKERESGDNSFWVSTAQDVETITSSGIIWLMPCGDGAHARVVSVVTFCSALLSAFSIILTAIFYSSHSNSQMKDSF
ncbi:hypothetical protein H6P81_000191 [Aristolochia fimbriata]|uniref:Phosphatidylinositol-glycan biosynthesis class X protein n=1 Tax=Aristolochia fimbriata TaxID=158543 RepID=A0AAV7F3U9_ARIFI|nr:hypothetical protein H6P81_000191 [Aristolochia fimbriata]